MFRIELPNRSIGINFAHEVDTIPVKGLKRRPRRMDDNGPHIVVNKKRVPIPEGMVAQRRTTCEIFEILGHDGEKDPKVRPIVHAVVKAHFRDQFTKHAGRLAALKACLIKLKTKAGFSNLDRLSFKERELLWKQYFKLSPPPSKPNPKKITRAVRVWLQKHCTSLTVEAINELKTAARIRG